MAMKLRIPQSPSITETSWLLSVISGHSLRVSYSSAEVQSLNSTAPANWARLLVLMHPHYLQCLRVYFLFLLLFLKHIVCQCNLSGVRSYTSSLVFLSSDLFVEILSPISRMISCILQRGLSRYLFFWWDFFGCKTWFQYFFSVVYCYFSICLMVSTSNIPKYF